MDSKFLEITPEQISDNTFKLIGKDWMLITAGSKDNFNTMTASWGGFGVLWGKPVCFCVVRPTRHTYGFMEEAENFTLSFFDENYRKALQICGSKSGRDTDKVSLAGLTPQEISTSSVSFEEARLVIECRKNYFQDLNPGNFLDPKIENNYPDKDYHRMYIGEIVKCLKK